MAAVATQQTPTSIRMTVSVIVVLPILFIYPMFQRFFVKGYYDRFRKGLMIKHETIAVKQKQNKWRIRNEEKK